MPGYSFMASVLFEEPDPKRQSELMEGVHAAKEKELAQEREKRLALEQKDA